MDSKQPTVEEVEQEATSTTTLDDLESRETLVLQSVDERADCVAEEVFANCDQDEAHNMVYMDAVETSFMPFLSEAKRIEVLNMYKTSTLYDSQ